VTHPDRDDLAAYALGALEPGEERAVGDHAAECPICAGELRERLASAVRVLAESVEQVEPPPELRERLLGIVREEADAGSVDSAAPARSGARRGRLRGFLLRPAAGLVALAVAGAGVAGYLVRDDEGSETSTVPIAAQAGINGSLVVADDSAVLSVRGMQQLPEGAVYQVWVARGSSVRPASSFVPNPGGGATAAVPGNLPVGSEVLVTRESRPGRSAPTTEPLLSARVD
jgi:anti-sigma factor RsiW